MSDAATAEKVKGVRAAMARAEAEPDPTKSERLWADVEVMLKRYGFVEDAPEEPDPLGALVAAGTALGKTREEIRQLDSVGKLLEEAKPTEGAGNAG